MKNKKQRKRRIQEIKGVIIKIKKEEKKATYEPYYTINYLTPEGSGIFKLFTTPELMYLKEAYFTKLKQIRKRMDGKNNENIK